MQRDFDNLAADMGASFGKSFERNASPRIRKAADRAADAFDVVRLKEAQAALQRQKAAEATTKITLLEKDYAKAVRDSGEESAKATRIAKQLATQRTAQATATTRATAAETQHAKALRASADAQHELDDVTRASRRSSSGRRGGAGRDLMWATAVPAAGALAGVAVTATQAIGAMPAVLSAVMGGFATVAMGVHGFGDALKEADPAKFNELVAELAPNAQSAAKGIRALTQGPLKELQQSTQDRLFAGVAEELHNLTDTLLPTVRDLTTNVADSLNGMFRGFAGQLMDPGTQVALKQTFDGIADTFDRLAPAMAPFTSALVDLTAVGSGVVADLAGELTTAAREFAVFIRNARESGRLREFMEDGVQAVKDLVDVAYDVGRAFASLAPIAHTILPPVASVVEKIADILSEHPALIWAVVGAFTAWKSISAVGALASSLTAISTLLGSTIPASAAAGAASISSALASIAVPAWLTTFLAAGGLPGVAGGYLLGANEYYKANHPGAVPDNARARGAAGIADRIGQGVKPAPSSPTGGREPGWGGEPFALPKAGFDPYNPIGIAGDSAAKGALAIPGGWNGFVDPAKAWGITGPDTSTGGGSSAKDAEGRVPNLVALEEAVERIFGVQANADTGRRDSFGEHGSGEALDIMVGSNQALGDQINRWLLLNAKSFGLQYNLWRRASWDPSGSVRPMEDRGSPTANHMDHVHARVSPGAAEGIPYMPPGMSEYQLNDQFTGFDYDRTQHVAVDSFGPSATSTLQQQIGAPLDQDFGFSKGLPGIFENLFKTIANFAMAPVLGALSGVTAAYGTAGPGTGILGAFAPRQNIFGQEMPNVLGQYPQTSATGYTSAPGGYGGGFGSPSFGLPGLDSFANGAPIGSPASGVGLGPPPGPTPGLGNFAPPGGAPAPTGWWPGMSPHDQTAPLGSVPVQRGQGFPTPMTPGASALQLQTGMAHTPSRGIMPGQGLPASQGIGLSGGGLLGMASSAASSAAGMAAGAFTGGGGGAAASAASQIGIDLINRAIGFGGQAAGIGVQGIMETLLPVESELADPSRGWFGRILGAVAGIRPAAQLNAGQLTESLGGDGARPPLTPEQAEAQNAHGRGEANPGPGNTQNITINNNNATPDQNGAAVARHAATAAKGPGR